MKCRNERIRMIVTVFLTKVLSIFIGKKSEYFI